MSASPSDSTGTSDSESNHSSCAPSPPQFQGPPAASTRSKKSMAQPTASSRPAPPTPQPPSASTRAKKQSVQSTKSSPGIKHWNVQSTKSVTRRDHNKVTSPVVGSGQTSGPSTLPSDVEEVVEIVEAVSQTPKPADVSNAESRDSPTVPKPIHGERFNVVVRHIGTCRMNLMNKFHNFLKDYDPKALHSDHLVEPPTVEAKLPQIVQARQLNDMDIFLQGAILRMFWEVIKDLQATETLVFQTFRAATNLLSSKPRFDKSEVNKIMGHLTTINTAIDAFCTRMTTRLTLTPEQRTVFSETDLVSSRHLCFRLAALDVLPSFEMSMRLLWAVYPVHAMRHRFFDWNETLVRSNAEMKAMLDTLSATISAAGNADEVQTEARGLKRKAEDVKDENEQ